MYILRIEHPVPNFDGWKAAFDNDPINRAGMGVRQYRVMRPVDDDLFAMVDLEFDSVEEAEACLAALRDLWTNVQGIVMNDPRVRVIEVVENRAP
jgi:hypothetical protein